MNINRSMSVAGKYVKPFDTKLFNAYAMSLSFFLVKIPCDFYIFINVES